MPSWIILTATAMLGACAARGGSTAAALPTDAAREEAIAALSASGRGPLLSESDIRDVARGLEAIRAHEPVLRHVGPVRRDVQVDLHDSVAARLPGSDRRRDTVVASTGIAAIDSVSRELKVGDVAISWGSDATLTPRFTLPVNAAAAEEAYLRLPQVQFASLQFAGDGNLTSVNVRFAGGVIHYHFLAAWGDCMSGCISHHRWQYTWDPRTGSVRRVSESGDPVEDWIGPRPDGG